MKGEGSMNELMIFSNEEFGQIRTVEIEGKPYFSASDVANALGYSNPRDAVSRHCKGVVKHDIPTSSGTQTLSFIPEGDIYRLIAKSQLPSAEKFESWVFDEVLPSIRKNGGYIANQENMTPEQIVANALIVAQNIIADRDRQIEEMKPKADYFDALVDRKLNTSFRDTAKELGIGEKRFIAFLTGKYVYRDSNNKLRPYAAYTTTDNKLFVVKEFRAKNSDHAGIQTLITPKGRETFRLLLEKED